jgi:hypothetical protein
MPSKSARAKRSTKNIRRSEKAAYRARQRAKKEAERKEENDDVDDADMYILMDASGLVDKDVLQPGLTTESKCVSAKLALDERRIASEIADLEQKLDAAKQRHLEIRKALSQRQTQRKAAGLQTYP